MRAWQVNPAAADGRLVAVSLPVPRPGPDEVLLRIRAASLNYRDLLVADNVYGSKATERVPLSDGAGEVVEVGDRVSDLTVGARVATAFYPDWRSGPITAEARSHSPGATSDGVLAEHVVVPAHAAIPLPEHLSFEEGATLPCAGVTAWNALTEVTQTGPGQTVLLQGTGGVSIMALQLAKALGARVIHTSSAPEKLMRLRDLGADEVIDYRAAPDWDRDVMRLTEGRGADLVVEVGGPATLERSFRAVRVGGTIVSIGFVGGNSTIDPRAIIGRAIRLVGITVGSCAMFADMNRTIARHGLRPVIDSVLSFEEAPAAYERLRAARHFGKIVVRL